MKTTKKILCILLAFSMIFTLVACNNTNKDTNNGNTDLGKENSAQDLPVGQSTYPFRFTDDSGKELVIEKEPQKIASGSPSITEIIFAIGKADKLVGVTEACNYPEEAKSKDKIGDYTGPNVEKLIEYGVDLFITDIINDDAKATLENSGIIVAIIVPKRYEDVFNRIGLLGEILNANDEAKTLLVSMKDKEKAILGKIDGFESKRVFHEVWNEPLMASGPNTFIDEMITMCGSANVAHDAESSFPQYNVEMLIDKNPQVYITADDGFKTIDDIKERTGFNEIDAIKNDRIYFLNPDVISRPGPRIVDALELVAKAIYPEAYK